MNIKEYIDSGILEDYVLHSATDQERREVECMAKIYPQIQAELARLQAGLQGYIELQKTTPPAHLKNKIFESIRQLPPLVNETIEHKPKLVIKKNNWPYYAAAATLVCFLASSYMYLQSNKEAARLQLELSGANLRQNEMLDQVKKYSQNLEILRDPSVKKIKLSGLPEKDSQAFAMLLWNPVKRELYLDQSNLPALPQEKQYQLWALKGGTPIDMGVFDGGLPSSSELIKMNDVDAAEAFAVTVEKRGGVPSPTLTEMVVLGKI